MPYTFSQHAAKRCQQRAIPLNIIEMIYAYGTTYRSHAATGYTLDKEALKWAEDDLEKATFHTLERYIGAYLIMGDKGTIITAAYQTRRRLN